MQDTRSSSNTPISSSQPPVDRTGVEDDGRTWINPIGGYGDVLMISGVLKAAHDRDPERKFNLIRRTRYLSILGKHPAIARVGHPPKGATIRGTDYWAMEELGPGNQRPFQILARAFGLKTPIEEVLYYPGDLVEDPVLHDFLPWKQINVAIAPASDSPRKVLRPEAWHELVGRLQDEGSFVAQLGRANDLRIRNAYSLLGLTTIQQLLSLLRRFDVVVTADNLLMHAAHLVGTPAAVIWGATRCSVYGYPGQVHMQLNRQCERGPEDDCIGGDKTKGAIVYGSPCPMGPRHCIDQVDLGALHDAVHRALQMRPIPAG